MRPASWGMTRRRGRCRSAGGRARRARPRPPPRSRRRRPPRAARRRRARCRSASHTTSTPPGPSRSSRTGAPPTSAARGRARRAEARGVRDARARPGRSSESSPRSSVRLWISTSRPSLKRRIMLKSSWSADALAVEQQLVARVEDAQVAEHLALVGQEGGVAARAGLERLDVVGDLALQEVLDLGAGERQLAALGAVEQPAAATTARRTRSGCRSRCSPRLIVEAAGAHQPALDLAAGPPRRPRRPGRRRRGRRARRRPPRAPSSASSSSSRPSSERPRAGARGSSSARGRAGARTWPL